MQFAYLYYQPSEFGGIVTTGFSPDGQYTSSIFSELIIAAFVVTALSLGQDFAFGCFS